MRRRARNLRLADIATNPGRLAPEQRGSSTKIDVKLPFTIAMLYASCSSHPLGTSLGELANRIS